MNTPTPSAAAIVAAAAVRASAPRRSNRAAAAPITAAATRDQPTWTRGVSLQASPTAETGRLESTGEAGEQRRRRGNGPLLGPRGPRRPRVRPLLSSPVRPDAARRPWTEGRDDDHGHQHRKKRVGDQVKRAEFESRPAGRCWRCGTTRRAAPPTAAAVRPDRRCRPTPTGQTPRSRRLRHRAPLRRRGCTTKPTTMPAVRAAQRRSAAVWSSDRGGWPAATARATTRPPDAARRHPGRGRASRPRPPPNSAIAAGSLQPMARDCMSRSRATSRTSDSTSAAAPTETNEDRVIGPLAPPATSTAPSASGNRVLAGSQAESAPAERMTAEIIAAARHRHRRDHGDTHGALHDVGGETGCLRGLEREGVLEALQDPTERSEVAAGCRRAGVGRGLAQRLERVRSEPGGSPVEAAALISLQREPQQRYCDDHRGHSNSEAARGEGHLIPEGSSPSRSADH